MLAPIVLFVYNRLDCLQRTINSLKKNRLSRETDLYIFSDGPKNEKDLIIINTVRNYLDTITGFRKIERNYSSVNKGLASSIIEGVTLIIKKYGKVIVVEDDLIVSSNFLDWMNQALVKFQFENNIFSVSGFSPQIKCWDYPYDSFMARKAHCWGWGTWSDRWETVDWNIADWNEFRFNKKNQKEFDQLGSEMSGLLFACMEGRICSWWIRFSYNQFKQNKLTVYPCQSKVINDGFTSEATHCCVYNRYRVDFDMSGKEQFNFSFMLMENKCIARQFYSYYSVKARVLGKLKTYLMKLGIIKQYTN